MKKLLSIILAAAMVMSLIPSVFALGVGDDGVVTYTFARGAVKKADGEAISDFDKSEIKGIWEWMEEPGSTAESPVHYSKGWFVGNLVGFGGHGWKFFGMNGAALAAAATQMRIGHLNSEYLQIANRVTNNNNTGTVNDDTIKLGLTLEKPEKGFYSVSVAAAPKNLGKNYIR